MGPGDEVIARRSQRSRPRCVREVGERACGFVSPALGDIEGGPHPAAGADQFPRPVALVEGLVATPLACRAALRELLIALQRQPASGVVLKVLEGRYGIPVSGETADPAYWLEAAAARHTSGDSSRMAQRLLDDFRKSALGSIALELPA